MEDQFYDRKCGCGKTFRECNFWQTVRDHIPEEQNFASRLLLLKDRVDHTRFFWKICSKLYSSKFEHILCEYKKKLEVLYRAISKATEGKVIIDSSKVPSRALILSEIDEIDIEFVHLVRDPRAVAYSWAKRVKSDPSLADKTLDYHPAWWSSLKWVFVNLSAQYLKSRGNYSRVIYEKFVKYPYEVMAEVGERSSFINEETISFVNRRTVEMPVVHSMSGNPQRFDTGQVEIRNKAPIWKEEMSMEAYLFTTAVTWPLLLKYGYRPW